MRPARGYGHRKFRKAFLRHLDCGNGFRLMPGTRTPQNGKGAM
jgi:hypothetical protein